MLKISGLCLLVLPLASMASLAPANMPVKVFNGTSHYPWLKALGEIPDYRKNWKPESSNTAISLSHILVSYPEEENPYKLSVNSAENHGSLQLANLTSFKLDAYEAGYFGLHYRNSGEGQQMIGFVLSMDDGSKVIGEIKAVNHEKMGFAGLIAEKDRTIKEVEINLPEGSSLNIEEILWGSLPKNDQAILVNKPVEDQEREVDDMLKTAVLPFSCNLTPEVVQYQCDHDEWLFDVKVSANDPRFSWWCSNDEDEQCASYEKVVSYGYYLKADNPQVQLVFTDQDQLNCSQSLTVNLPESCEDNCSYRFEGGKAIESCEKDGKLVTTMKDISSLNLSVSK